MKKISWISYLRASLIVLVVAHHSALAYTTFARFNSTAYILSTHPVVDRNRWVGLDYLVSFNDTFFMSLLFLIGGLFLSKSIATRGRIQFFRARTYRLLIPFLVLGTFFMLIAYFPAYYIAHDSVNIFAYIKDFFTVEKWPVGPPWFIWVLFSFNIIFLLINPYIQKLKSEINYFFYCLACRPLKMFLLLYLITWALYAPLAYLVGPYQWVGFGPFDFQLCRILLYLGYFTIGGLIGNTDFNQILFSRDSVIIKRWPLWILMSLCAFLLFTLSPKILARTIMNHHIEKFPVWWIYHSLFAVSCSLSCLACIAGFRKLKMVSGKWWDSLSDNSYLIYLVHYIFIVWTQFVLLKSDMPAVIKFMITFTTALSFSWFAAGMLRKIKIIRSFI